MKFMDVREAAEKWQLQRKKESADNPEKNRAPFKKAIACSVLLPERFGVLPLAPSAPTRSEILQSSLGF